MNDNGEEHVVFPRGVRPAATWAVSERERARAHPHRHQAARNWSLKKAAQQKERWENRPRKRGNR